MFSITMSATKNMAMPDACRIISNSDAWRVGITICIDSMNNDIPRVTQATQILGFLMAGRYSDVENMIRNRNASRIKDRT